MKDKNDKRMTTKASGVLASKDVTKKIAPILQKKGPRMQSLMKAVFSSPLPEEGSENPSLGQNAEVTTTVLIEKAIEALEPEKISKPATASDPKRTKTTTLPEEGFREG